MYARTPAVPAAILAAAAVGLCVLGAPPAASPQAATVRTIRAGHAVRAWRPVRAPEQAPGRPAVVPATLSVRPATARPRPLAGVLRHIRATGGAVALTFDDGPSPQWTPQVLALLRARHLRATFCLVGREARAYPALVRQIVAAGHTLCDHTQTHDEHVGYRPAAWLRAEVKGGYDAIVWASGGVRPRYFRAPGGRWTPRLLAEVRAERMVPLGWSVDPRDWSRPGTAPIVRVVLAGARPGSIILLHDGGGRRDETVAALRELLPIFAARRLRPVVP